MLRESVQKLNAGMTQFSSDNRKMKETLLDIQTRSMRDNLVFSGILERTEKDSEVTVRDFLQTSRPSPGVLFSSRPSGCVGFIRQWMCGDGLGVSDGTIGGTAWDCPCLVGCCVCGCSGHVLKWWAPVMFN
ncbi:hypothetical protein AMECASPLE_010790 [Ameca splendens]|uniref:Uncharacterized protein n=1 Tax=Ameca splendens TaxID=208324 RepID=A0ABV0ZKM3_9TELE